jgi:hypothetical protein
MEQRFSSRGIGCSEKFSAFYWIRRSIPFFTRAPSVPILDTITRVHALRSNLRSVVILLPRFSPVISSFWFFYQNLVCASYSCCMACPCHLPWFDHSNNICEHELWSTSLYKFVSPPFILFLLGLNILSVPCFQTPSACALPWMWSELGIKFLNII